MIYFTKHYGISTSTIAWLAFVLGLGALIGVVMGGYIAGWLLRRGRLDARLLVPAVALFASVPLFGAGVWLRNVYFGVTLLTVGAAVFAAAIAPIDAARLDIVHPRIWGRGEAGRMALRSLLEGGAPLLFGAVSGWLGGGEKGLEWTFLLMLIPILIAGSLAWPARRTYLRDVATAAASVKATAGTAKNEPGPPTQLPEQVPDQLV
jgi:MFS family permease